MSYGDIERQPSGPRNREIGYVLFTMAATIVVLGGFAGLVFDAGCTEFVRLQAQAAADAGAKRGAFAIRENSSATITAAAKQDTANNGFRNGSSGVTITVNNPPASGSSALDSDYSSLSGGDSIRTGSTFSGVTQ